MDGANYSTGFPTGTNAGDYEVWYRVKGDGNHNDVAGTKLSGKVNIARQTVSNPTIEFTPAVPDLAGLAHDGQRALPRREDGEYLGRRPGDGVVAVRLAGNRDRVVPYVLPVGAGWRY